MANAVKTTKISSIKPVMKVGAFICAGSNIEGNFWLSKWDIRNLYEELGLDLRKTSATVLRGTVLQFEEVEVPEGGDTIETNDGREVKFTKGGLKRIAWTTKVVSDKLDNAIFGAVTTSGIADMFDEVPTFDVPEDVDEPSTANLHK